MNSTVSIHGVAVVVIAKAFGLKRHKFIAKMIGKVQKLTQLPLVADLAGRRDAHLAQYFSFHAAFGKNLPNYRTAPPFGLSLENPRFATEEYSVHSPAFT